MTSVKLNTKEGTQITIDNKSLQLSDLLHSIVESDDLSGGEIEVHLSQFEEETLTKVVAFCYHFAHEQGIDAAFELSDPVDLQAQVSPWYWEFIDMSGEELEKLKQAANHMDIKPLYYLCEGMQKHLSRQDD